MVSGFYIIMEDMDISIIVPAYNSEKYLERCIDSIEMALKKYSGKGEIILVDNGSTDKSFSIMQKRSEKQSKLIKIDRCTTKGAAAVRNYGAKKARGEFIWFIDADDTIREDAVLKLMKTAKDTKADLVMLGVERVYQDGHTDYLSAVCPKQPNYRSRFVRYGVGPFQLLIRRAWWEKHGFEFREGRIHEDMELLSALVLYTDSFACVDEPLYSYYQNPESVLHKSKWDPHYFDIFPALEGLYERFEQMGAAKNYHDELEWFFIWNLLIDSAKDFGKFKEGKAGFGRTRKMLKQYFPKWRRNRFLRQKPLKLQLLVRINYHK